MPIQKVIIIGGGAAGWTAAIYAARAQLEPIVFEGWQPGGQLTLTSDVENYPGFEHGVSGPELMEILKRQAMRFGTRVISDSIESVDFADCPFGLVASSGESWKSRTVIIATGASEVMLGVEGEARLLGRGVSTCATCDGALFRGKRVAVIGGGDTAIEEALVLTKFADQVIVVHRRDSLRASKIMQERAFSHSRIEFLWNSVVESFHGDTRLSAISLRDLKSDLISERDIDGAFVAIGRKPNTDMFVGKLELDAAKYIVTRSKSTATSVDGVFACGNVQDSIFRQVVTGAGTGCMAAMEVERWMEKQ